MGSLATPNFTEIPLEANKRKKEPKRRLHFSDGYLDEYSTDEEDCSKPTQTLVDPSTLAWMPYLWYLTVLTGSKALAACDYLGEHLAYFFGITSPKFQYEIEHYKAMLEEEEKLKKQQDAEYAGWTAIEPVIITSNPIETLPQNSEVKINDILKTNNPEESKSFPVSDKKSQPETWERY